MKPLPIKAIRKLVKEFQDTCKEQSGVDLELEITGALTVSKENELVLAVAAEGDLQALIQVPGDATVSTEWHRDAESEGSLTYRLKMVRRVP